MKRPASSEATNRVMYVGFILPYPFEDAGDVGCSPTWKQRRCIVRRPRSCIF
jgi:hypothetical protein